MDTTDIQKYYTNKNILITGATGFIGKTIVEKLLRSCADLNKIIITIRSKKGQSFESRIADFFNDTLFDQIKENNKNVINKVAFVETNLENDNIGLNEYDYNVIISSVNVIIHCAATVHFKGPLYEAILSNIVSTKNIIELAKNIQQLEAFIHVSTLWSHAVHDFKPEKVIHNSYDPEFLIHLVKNIDKEKLKKITLDILDIWPNTYLFTKHASEILIDREKDRLPLVIFRVPGVGPIYHEPISGWVNAFQGVSLVGIGLASGLIKVFKMMPEIQCDILPADYVINCIIASVWLRAKQNGNELKVYNYGCLPNKVTRKKYLDSFVNTKYPLECTTWTPGYISTSSDASLAKYNIFYQVIPAKIYDFFRMITFQNPKYMKIINNNNKLMDTVGWFFSTDCNYEFENVPCLWNMLSDQDKQLFYFDIREVNWNDYLDVYCKSIKFYLKEDFNNLYKSEVNRSLLKAKY